MGTTTLFEYDNYGNITRKCIADYTPDDDEDVHTVYNYTYAKGRLKSYGGKNCEYDNIGNPTTYLGKSAEWKGKQLTSYAGTTFTYDGKGRRINKGNITFTYDCEGNLAQQSNGMSFFYDSQGVSGFAYGGNNYYYKKDALGDVIAILDATGATVASYEYNAWGEHSISGNTTIGNLNPFRYRSYYYDTETGLYYLQTRYYDPVTCRFLNMDSIKYAEPTSIGGLNLYAYCNNNPVMYTDPTGTFIGALVAGALIGGLGSGIFKAIGAAIKGESALSCFGSFVGGFITGAALGAATVLGGGLAVGAFATTAVTVAGMAAYLTVGTFAIGMWSYWLEGKIKGNQFDWDAAFINGGLTMAQGLMSFVIGAAMGYAGLYDSLKPGNGFGDILKATKQFELIEAGQVSKDILTNVFTTYMNENISAMSVRFLVKSIFVSPWNLVRP